METTPTKPRVNYLLVYLMVLHDGSVFWGGHDASHLQCHEANFIVIQEDDGTLVVWKDRFGEHGREVNAQWTGIRAAQHLRWIQLAREADQQAAEMCRSFTN